MTATAADAGGLPFTCARTDTLLGAIEKCLDNHAGTCFVVGADQRLIGRVTLEDLRHAIVDGSAVDDAGIERCVSSTLAPVPSDAGRLRNDPAPGDDVVTPVVDGDGRLIDVRVDHSRAYVQIARPDLSHREFRTILDAFLSSWISSKGEYIAKFEQEFAAFAGMRHGVAVSSGTSALHLGLLALGIGPGDEVIVPDLTFAATVNAVLHCGATPVIVDVDPTTWTMSLDTVARAFTTRTKAVIPVHLYGRPAEIGPIAEFARSRRCFVVEDCAEAHGARYAGRMVGRFSDVACFSFYANKLVTSGEGGMCLTDSPAVAADIRTLRDHGMAPDRFYWHTRVGFNARMTNIQAAIGLMQLRRIRETLRRNRYIEDLYRQYFRTVPGIAFAPPLGPEYEPIVWLVSAHVSSELRPRLIEAAARAGIEIRPFFHPISAMPAFIDHARPCPNSAALSRTGINLPTSSVVDMHVIEKIGCVVRSVLG